METTEEMQARWAKAIAEAGVANEQQMRDAPDPWPPSLDELSAYVKTLTDRPHDYGTCCYAMSLAATAAFNYVAHVLGVTGFQASCADLDFLRRSRGYKHGFLILNGSNVLYPQYDLVAKAAEFVEGKRAELRDEAAKLLRENGHAAERVREHWKSLSAPSTKERG